MNIELSHPAPPPTGRACLTRRAVVRVAGPDARSYLQGLLTQDVEGIAPGEPRFAALLTPQGKFLWDMFLRSDGEDAILLEVDAGRRAELIQRLSIYRLRAKVEIAPDPAPVWAAWGRRPEGEAWLADPRLAELGWRAVGEVGQGADASEDDYDAWRLSLGVPDPMADCTPDKTFPIEANFDLLNGIDFKKGCFVGQETTSRMKRRGPVARRTLALDFAGPPPAPGAEVLAADLRAGEVLSGREGRAMALVRLDRVQDVALTVDGRPVRVVRPAWFPAEESQ